MRVVDVKGDYDFTIFERKNYFESSLRCCDLDTPNVFDLVWLYQFLALAPFLSFHIAEIKNLPARCL